jgi:hypothetical protein
MSQKYETKEENIKNNLLLFAKFQISIFFSFFFVQGFQTGWQRFQISGEFKAAFMVEGHFF